MPSVEVTIADRGGDAPGRVGSLRVTAGHGTLKLTWTVPSTGAVTAYEAWYKKRSESDWSIATDDDYADTSVEIAGLDNGTRYDVRVRGTNDYGAGPWATATGTPTGGGGVSGQLGSLTVTASATRDGTYAAAALSPSFRSSATDYTATAAAGANFVKVRPTSADGEEVLVEGMLVKSGAESGPIGTANGQSILIAVFRGDGTPNHYVVTMSIPAASRDAEPGVPALADAARADAALWLCDGAVGPTAAIVPEPGTLAVEWTGPAGGPRAAGALVEIGGPDVGEVRAPGLELYESGEGSGPRRFVIAGPLGDGPVIEFRVPDASRAGLYTVRVLEVAGNDHRLLDAEDYRAAITRWPG